MADVAIHLISKRKLSAMTTQQKLRFILDEIKADRILVLEVGLNPSEEAKLIETTMSEIDSDTFTGIEMESYRGEDDSPLTILSKFRKRNTATRAKMTVVGPANRLRTVKNDGSIIQAVIQTTRRRAA